MKIYFAGLDRKTLPKCSRRLRKKGVRFPLLFSYYYINPGIEKGVIPILKEAWGSILSGNHRAKEKKRRKKNENK